jgi:acetyl-CoA/propionyl-CoA carboxylase, biotin carboxylase, biotin carboxyl carrier protein
MFAKVIVSGEDRERARRRMLRALDEFHVEGVPTTIPLHRWVLESPDFRGGRHTTAWLERALRQAHLPSTDVATPGVEPKTAVPAELLVEVDGRRVPIRIFDRRRETAPRAPSRHSGAHGEGVHSVISAPMQGTILRVLVEEGQEIQAGDVVCILEAMKMENAIPAPREGIVSELPVNAGQVVQPGETIAIID